MNGAMKNSSYLDRANFIKSLLDLTSDESQRSLIRQTVLNKLKKEDLFTSVKDMETLKRAIYEMREQLAVTRVIMDSLLEDRENNLPTR